MRPPTAHRPRTARARASHRGNTLIEVMVSVLILSFGLLGLVAMQARATSFSVDAEDRNRAALLADDLAARMRLAGKVDLGGEVASWKDRVRNPVVAGLPNADASVTYTGTNVADITITWKAPAAPAAAASSQLTLQVVLTNEELRP